MGVPRSPGRPHLQQRDVLGGRRPAGQDRPAARTHRDRAAHWRSRADLMRDRIIHEAYDDERGAFMETWGGTRLDASTLVLPDLGLHRRRRRAVPRHARRRREAPASAATTCSGTSTPTTSVSRTPRSTSAPSGTSMRWRASGAPTRRASCSSTSSARRNHLGLMSEDLDPETGELWGNFPQTYSMLGIIQIAMRLSQPVGAGVVSGSSSCPTGWHCPGRPVPAGWPPRCRPPSPRTAASGSAGPARWSTPPVRPREQTEGGDQVRHRRPRRGPSTTPTTTVSPTGRCGRCCTTGSTSSTTAATPTGATSGSTASSPGMLAPMIRDDDLVWVQDYHLMPARGAPARRGGHAPGSGSSCTPRCPRLTSSWRCRATAP